MSLKLLFETRVAHDIFICFRKKDNGGSKRAYTVTDIPHLLWNNRICKDFQISTTAVATATAGRLVTYHWRGRAFTHITPPFDHLVLRDHVTNDNHYISTMVVPIATKPGRTHLERLGQKITWSFHHTVLQNYVTN